MSDIWQNCPVPLAMCLLGKFPKTLFCFWQIGYDNNRNDFEKNRLTEAGKKLTSVGGRKQRFYISFRYLKSLGGEVSPRSSFCIVQNIKSLLLTFRKFRFSKIATSEKISRATFSKSPQLQNY